MELFKPDGLNRFIGNQSDAKSVLSLLQEGLAQARLGHIAESIHIFTSVRQSLASNLIELEPAFDVLICSHRKYWQAQQALLTASKLFVEADQERHLHLEQLTNILTTLLASPSSARQEQDGSVVQLSGQPTPTASPLSKTDLDLAIVDTLPSLSFTCFGFFRVIRMGQTVELCSNRTGQTILRYLVAKTGHSESMDVLMELFWPEDPPDVARHKLVVAISALRRALNQDYASQIGGGYILCKNEFYMLNPNVEYKIDLEEFLALYNRGCESTSTDKVPYYLAASELYKGPFLFEDLYADWSLFQREQLNRVYLIMCTELAEYYYKTKHYEEAAKWCNRVLKEDRCDEKAHLYLMHIYLATNHRNEAIVQYQRCKNILKEEMGVEPIPEIQSLFDEATNNLSNSVSNIKK